MAYRLPLLNIYKMTDEDFSEIPPCDPTVITEKFITRTQEGQAEFFELCRQISPDKETAHGRPVPRYIPVCNYKYRGGCAVLFDALDTWNYDDDGGPLPVMLKIPWPIMRLHDRKEERDTPAPTPLSSKIERVALSSIQVAGKIYRKLIPPGKKKQETEPLEARENKDVREAREKQEHLSRESRQYEIFNREYLFQKQMHQRGIVIDKGRRYGYVPAAFDFGVERNPYISMELITGATPYMQWIQEHNDQENLDLFMKVVTFVRIVLHEGGIAHCDLKPANILVRGGVPVFLDFGTAKGEYLPTITLPGSQKGTPDTASPRQLEDAAERSYEEDVFALGRLFWKTVNRRNPPTDSILATEDDSGKLHFDAELLQSLFDDNSIPEKFRNAYKKTYQFQYEKLEDFQRDLEEALYIKPVQIQPSCVGPCDDLKKVKTVVSWIVQNRGSEKSWILHLLLEIQKILEEKRT